jgi:hypothetical protein
LELRFTVSATTTNAVSLVTPVGFNAWSEVSLAVPEPSSAGSGVEGFLLA